eukprot:365444-Chlamydomonas_euryale.AAC.11
MSTSHHCSPPHHFPALRHSSPPPPPSVSNPAGNQPGIRDPVRRGAAGNLRRARAASRRAAGRRCLRGAAGSSAGGRRGPHPTTHLAGHACGARTRRAQGRRNSGGAAARRRARWRCVHCARHPVGGGGHGRDAARDRDVGCGVRR